MRRSDEICSSVLNGLHLTAPVGDLNKIYEHYRGWECKAVAIAQKEAYNEAIDDVIKHGKVKGRMTRSEIIYEIDEESLLKLTK